MRVTFVESPVNTVIKTNFKAQITTQTPDDKRILQAIEKISNDSLSLSVNKDDSYPDDVAKLHFDKNGYSVAINDKIAKNFDPSYSIKAIAANILELITNKTSDVKKTIKPVETKPSEEIENTSMPPVSKMIKCQRDEKLNMIDYHYDGQRIPPDVNKVFLLKNEDFEDRESNKLLVYYYPDDNPKEFERLLKEMPAIDKNIKMYRSDYPSGGKNGKFNVTQELPGRDRYLKFTDGVVDEYEDVFQTCINGDSYRVRVKYINELPANIIEYIGSTVKKEYLINIMSNDVCQIRFFEDLDGNIDYIGDAFKSAAKLSKVNDVYTPDEYDEYRFV